MTELDFMPGYILHEKQRAFIRARKSYRHRRFVGGRQSGKTDVGSADSVLHATVIKPGGVGAIVGPTFPLALEARDRFNSMCPYELRSWNGSERRWTIQANGGQESTVHWISLSDPDAARGKVLDWVWLDECAKYAEEAMSTLRPCLSVKQGSSWGTTTPRGMNWLEKETRRDDTFFVHAQSIDNPAFPASEWETEIQRHGFDSPYFKQEHRGLFQAFIGQAIPGFDRTQHAVDSVPYSDKAMHVFGWDFGWTAPTVAIWFQVDEASETWVIKGCRLWTETERPVILAQWQLDGMNGTRPQWHAIDPSGGRGMGQLTGDKGWIYDMECGPRCWDVRVNRKVGETRRLNIIRQMVNEGRLLVDPDGENAEAVINAFETCELNDNPERDILKDQHPQADILDALGYPLVEMYGATTRITTSVH